MARIAVFDSGLGSMSVIPPIMRLCRADITYFADSASFPYGSKSDAELRGIIYGTISMLESRFRPDLTIVASNTPSLVLDIARPRTLTVKPPLAMAAAASRTKNIGVLATASAIASGGLDSHIISSGIGECKVAKLDCSRLVKLVEDGTFLTDEEGCIGMIRQELGGKLAEHRIDSVTLSSTHLPLLGSLIKRALPGVALADPAEDVARVAHDMTKDLPPGQGRLEIFTSGDPAALKSKLGLMGVDHDVESI